MKQSTNLGIFNAGTLGNSMSKELIWIFLHLLSLQKVKINSIHLKIKQRKSVKFGCRRYLF